MTAANTSKSSTWTPPPGFRRTLDLSTGKAQATVTHSIDTIDVKFRVFGRIYRGANGKSKPVTVKAQVKSTSVRIKLADGTVLKARSCCKPPDGFDEVLGVELAIKRLVKQNDCVVRAGESLLSGIIPALAESGKKISHDRAAIGTLVRTVRAMVKARYTAEFAAKRAKFAAKRAKRLAKTGAVPTKVAAAARKVDNN